MEYNLHGKENKQDAKKKGRNLSGQNHHFSRFTDMQIEEMRFLRGEGFTYARLKRIFNCSTVHIFNVIKNRYSYAVQQQRTSAHR